MPINFPDAPSTGTVYTIGDKTWTFDGTAWNLVTSSGSDHGGLGGLEDDDHTQYLLADGTRTATELTVTGTVTATEFVGHLQGPTHIKVKNTSGGSLSKGTPVYATGSVGASGTVEVQASLAGTASTMPALGLLDGTLANNAQGSATIIGVIRQVDTSSYSVNDSLYVSVSGGLTNVRPTGASELVQKIGRVVRSHASTGEILVLGAGRANDVPNNIVAGGLTIDTNTLVVDAANNRVGIGTTSPNAELDIRGASNPEIRLQSTDSSDPFLYFGDQVDAVRGGIGYDTSANALQLRGYNNSTRMTIDSSGNVGIGDTTPSYTLDVNGDINATSAVRVSGLPVGMVLVKSQAVGTGVTSVNVTGAFSSTFANYLITMSGGTGSADAPVAIRMGSSTTGYYCFLNYGNSTSGTPLGATRDNGSQLDWVGGHAAGQASHVMVEVFGPNLSAYTKIRNGHYQNGNNYGIVNGEHRVASAYTSFILFVDTGTLTGGTIRVYGYTDD
jgi:hypothetical protein